MTDRPPLLRSALFVPAANPRALEKSRGLKADALIFDLEDSAVAGERENARERLEAHLRQGPTGAYRVVRINALDGPWGLADLRMAVEAGVDAILLPKVASAQDVREAEVALWQAGAPPTVRLWAMIETAGGILASAEIAACGSSAGRLSALVAGPNDIALSTRTTISRGRPEILSWLSQIVLAARAHGLVPIDGVYNDITDTAGLAQEARQGAAMGFAGKTLLHPGQLDAANSAFSPSPQAIETARAIVAAFALPENADKGVIRLDGRMTERLHLTQAEDLLARQAEIEARS